MANNKSADAIQTIEQLQTRYNKFNKHKIVVETDRKHALDQLAKLKANALEQFGSDDLEQLQKTLEKMKSDNEMKRAKYQRDLDSIEQKLADIEERFEMPGE